MNCKNHRDRRGDQEPPPILAAAHPWAETGGGLADGRVVLRLIQRSRARRLGIGQPLGDGPSCVFSPHTKGLLARLILRCLRCRRPPVAGRSHCTRAATVARCRRPRFTATNSSSPACVVSPPSSPTARSPRPVRRSLGHVAAHP